MDEVGSLTDRGTGSGSGSGGGGASASASGLDVVRSPLRKRRRPLRRPIARNECSESLVQDLREEIEELKKQEAEKDELLATKDSQIDKLETDLAQSVHFLKLEMGKCAVFSENVEDLKKQCDVIRADRDKLARICDISAGEVKNVRAENEELRVRLAAAEARARARCEVPLVSVSRNASAEDEVHHSQSTPTKAPPSAKCTPVIRSSVGAVAGAPKPTPTPTADDVATPRKLDFTSDTKSPPPAEEENLEPERDGTPPPRVVMAPKRDNGADTGAVEEMDIVAAAAAKLTGETGDKCTHGTAPSSVPLRLRLKPKPGEAVEGATATACTTSKEVLLRLPLKTARGRVRKRRGKR